MKKLLPLLAIATTLFLSSCDKESKEAEYIVAVSGSDYADDLRIIYDFNSGMSAPLSLNNGEAVISATKKCTLELICRPYSEADNPTAPQHQTEGDIINFKIYQSKKGKKKDQVGEGSLMVSNLTNESHVFIKLEW